MEAKPGTAQWEKNRADYWFKAYCNAVDQRDAARREARMWRDRFFRAMRQLRKVRA
jgi:hypothetical protein